MAIRNTRSPQLRATTGTRIRRTMPASYGYQLPPGMGFGTGYGFTTGGGAGATGGGGGAPGWLCAIIGKSSCSYAEIVAAGLGHLLGTGGGNGNGSEPPSGNGGTPGSFTGDAAGPGGCPEGQTGFPPLCFDLTPGGGTSGGGMVVHQGEAVMGQYGAALQPEFRSQTTLRCPRGMVLGTDELCYNKRDLRKDERKWVPGRKPLLTGGDLNAISRAARAARRVKTTQKRLQKLGLLKKPTSRGRGGSRGVITKSEAAKALRS